MGSFDFRHPKTGNGARINGFSSQTVTFPANTGSPQTVTLTVTDNGSCDGTEVLTFGLENLTGGQGTPFVGPNASRSLTITDNDATTGHVIARQAFDGLGSDNWAITSGAGNISTNAGGSDFPSSSRILSGTSSWQTSNATNVLELGSMDVSGYANVSLNLRVAATTTSNTNGLDAADSVKVFISLNGAPFSATADVAVRGNSNSRWTYTGSQSVSTTAGVPIVVQSLQVPAT